MTGRHQYVTLARFSAPLRLSGKVTVSVEGRALLNCRGARGGCDIPPVRKRGPRSVELQRGSGGMWYPFRAETERDIRIHPPNKARDEGRAAVREHGFEVRVGDI